MPTPQLSASPHSTLPQEMALGLTQISTCLGVCERLLAGLELPQEALHRFQSSLRIANRQIEQSGRRVRNELRKPNREFSAATGTNSVEMLVQRSIGLMHRRLSKAALSCEVGSQGKAEIACDAEDFLYLMTGLLTTLLPSVQDEQGSPGQVQIYIGRVQNQLIIQVLAQITPDSQRLRTDCNLSQQFLEKISCEGFHDYQRLLSKLKCGLRLTADSGQTKACLHFEVQQNTTRERIVDGEPHG